MSPKGAAPGPGDERVSGGAGGAEHGAARQPASSSSSPLRSATSATSRPRAAARLQEADVVCCEDTRHTGQLLARLGLKASRLLSVHAHNERERVAEVIALLGPRACESLS